VNGDYVFLSDFERQATQYERSLTELGLDPTPARAVVLERMIDAVLIEQAAAEMGIILSDEALEEEVEASIAAGGGQAAFDEWLQATGATREDYAEELRQALLAQQIWEVVTADVPEAVEQVHARQIVVDSEEVAQQVLVQLQEGIDFVALARDQSLDLATKDNGGDLGWFPRGIVAIELEQAAFALQPGEISDPFWLAEQLHIVQVIEREVAHPLTAEMHLQLMQDKFDQWLEERRAEAIIERFVGE
jgi:parvulin-like peptidyl-prolyl isomerase